jgi:hypothetical protein
MKILARAKDYFHHLQGIYGVDEKLILDCTRFTNLYYLPADYTKVQLHVGEWMIEGMWMNKVVLYGEALQPYHKPRKYEHFFTSYDEKTQWIVETNKIVIDRHTIYKEPVFLGDKSPTWKEDYPILLQIAKDRYDHNPILKEYNLQKVFSAEQVWQILSEWLSKQITRNEPEVPVGDDKSRIQAAGFDLKHSFRNTK